MDMTMLAVVVAGFVFLGLVMWLSRKNSGSDDQLADIIQSLHQQNQAQNQEMAGRIAHLSDESRKAQSELAKALNDRLDNVTRNMGASLKESAEKTAKSIGEIQTRLTVIDKAQENIRELSNDIVGLQDILSNNQARGAFGEVQLNNLISQALEPDAYSFQASLSTGVRPDCLLQLPNPPGPIAIDAKFPLARYHAYMNAKDESELKAAVSGLKTDVKKHIDAIADKYLIPGETADSALMFLPSEAVYAELHANFQDLIDHSHRSRVYLVSPTTLWATLNTIRAVLRDVKMREQAGIIQREVGKLAEDAKRLDTRVDNLGKHFGQVSKDIDLIQTSTRKIVSKSEKITSVQLEKEEGLDEVIDDTIDPKKLL